MPDTLSQTPEALRHAAHARALELGFDWFGVARAETLVDERRDLERFLAEGRHGQMEWLARDPERRTDPEKVLPGCQSVVVLGINYLVEEELDRRDPQPAGKVARYARGRDYHRVMDKRLKKLARYINQIGPEGTHSKPYVDHGPVMERQWAARAGLGFIGKHTLLINPRQGSWFLLGVVLTTAELAPTAPVDPFTACGDCRRCLDACPTGAITEPWRFDARRCISYLTIEHRGEIEPELADKLSSNVFGCDICQEVCPYNIKRAQPSQTDKLGPRLVPAEWSLAEIANLEESTFAEQYAQSPLRRAGAEKLKRNAKKLG